MRFVRAFLDQPPQKMFFVWGDVPAGLVDWVQAPDLWRIILYGHVGTVWQNARPIAVKPLDGVLFAPGARGSHPYTEDGTRIASAVFDLPAAGRREVALPTTFQVTPEDYESLWIAGEHGGEGPERGKALTWHLLWRLSRPASVLRDQTGIYEVEDYIRANIAAPLLVAEVSKRFGIAQRTLLSWFQSEHGTTAKGFIRQVRAREACRLLAETDLSVKAIAARVGIADLHQFNKVVRGHVGLAPRTYRDRTSRLAGSGAASFCLAPSSPPHD